MSLVQSSNCDDTRSRGGNLKSQVAAWLLTLCYAAFVLPLARVSHWMVTEIGSPFVNQVWGVSGLILFFVLALSAASLIVFLLLRAPGIARIATGSLVVSRYGTIFLMLWGLLVALQAYRDKNTVYDDWRLIAVMLSLLYFSLAPGLVLVLCLLLTKSVSRLRESTSGK